MKTYVVLFRGINVGGKNMLPMKQLAAVLADNNYEDIKTYIQSGNLVLNSQINPENNIGTLIHCNFGFKPEVLSLAVNEFIPLINMFGSAPGETLVFTMDKPGRRPCTSAARRAARW